MKTLKIKKPAKAAGSQAERRSGMRVKLDDLAVLTTREKEERPVIVKDISRRGVCLETNFPLRSGEAYQVTLQSALFQVEAKKMFKCVWCARADERIWRAGLQLDGTQLP